MSEKANSRSMATAKDVAAAAGVSITAVSLVCNRPGGTNRVSKATAARILQAARQLGYRPNSAAQRLAMRRSRLIGVVTYDFGSFAGLRRLEATMRCLVERGYEPLLWSRDWSDDGWEDACDMLLSNNVAGVILEHLESVSDQQAVQRLLDTQIPVVSLDGTHELPGAGVDRRGEFRRLAQAAICAGHRHMGYLARSAPFFTASTRLEGIKEAIAECGHDVELALLRPLEGSDGLQPNGLLASSLGFDVGERGATLYLESDQRPSAVICSADDAAIAFMHVVQAAGVRVPDDVAVFGFDGVPAGKFSSPTLTTVAQPLEELGTEVVTRLLDLIERPAQASREHVLLPGRLIIRESSGPIPESMGVDAAEDRISAASGHAHRTVADA